MSQEAHFRKLENMYHAAPCNAHYAPTLSVSQGHADLVLPVRPDLFHAAGAVHGSVYFKAMDDSAFFSANSLVEDVFVLTSSFTVYFTRPINSGQLRAVANVVSQTGRQLIAEAVVYDAEGRQIGRGSGCFVKSTIPLGTKLGYK